MDAGCLDAGARYRGRSLRRVRAGTVEGMTRLLIPQRRAHEERCATERILIPATTETGF